MNILEKIVEHKRKEVAARKELYPVKLLEKSIYFETPTVSLRKYLKRDDKVGIIAEIKRRSPSEGDINPYIDVENLSIGYMQAGASALSVLTDTEFFGGSAEDLKTARKYNFCPILRKDFIVDEYQLVEAKSIGADAVLLIAAVLEPGELKQLAQAAGGLGLEVLLEVHSGQELDTHHNDHVHVVGVNNRNLEDFSVSLDTSLELASKIHSDMVRVSESGISTPESIVQLKEAGYNGFLIGTHFMRHAVPQQACADLIGSVNKLLKSHVQEA
jgi:indole-3-glycerol phosphate synthase